eukprot:gb/GECH01001748.1/.p1 GENE.gb/GECH01001748.1/~~gb/GECH01001748.1/.p1  ORF type:complete len:632 (+),score=176.41 gb/GECH01001748.1/:1-1896(+)
MRRSTLGNLSTSMANARGSMRPSSQRFSMKPNNPRSSRNSSVSRNSMASNASRPSMSFRGHSEKDPRPLKSKEFQNNAKQTIIEYLVQHNFDHPVNPQMLNSKDVVMSILFFLIHKIDPHLDLSSEGKHKGTPEEKIYNIFKMLGYTGTLTKSTLQSVGTLHGMPHVLGALLWLVELLSAQENAKTNNTTMQNTTNNSSFLNLSSGSNLHSSTLSGGGGGGESTGSEPSFVTSMDPQAWVFFKFVEKGYRQWISTGMEDEALDRHYQEMFDEKNKHTMNEIERLTEEIKDLQQELDSFENNPSELEMTKRNREEMQKGLYQMKQFIHMNHQYTQNTQDLQIRGRQELSELQETIKNLENEKKDLQDQLSRQELSPEDVEQMNQEKMQLEDQLQTLTEQLDDLKATKRHSVKEISSELDALEKLVVEYNKIAGSVLLIPREAEHAQGQDFQMALKRDGRSTEEMINLDMAAFVRPRLQSLREEYLEKVRHIQTELMEKKEELENSEESVSYKEDDIDTLNTQLENLNQQHERRKKDMDYQLKQIHNETSQTQEHTERLKSIGTDELEAARRRVDELEQRYEQLVMQFSTEKQHVNDLLISAIDALTNHKEHVQESLVGLEEKHLATVRQLEE